MAKEKPDPRHRIGARTNNGYNVNSDGSFTISPGNASRMEEIIHEREGVDDLVRSISQFTTKAYTQIAKRQSRFWDDMKADLGLEPGALYFYQDGTIFPKKEEKKEGSDG